MRKNTYTNGKIKVEINKNRRILFKYAYFFTIFLENSIISYDELD